MSIKCPKCDTENTQDSQFCKKCATQLPIQKGQPAVTKTLETPASELTRGYLIAERYEIIEELGKGGMGSVYKALDKELKEEVALKLIKPGIASDKKTIERFKNELKLARKIGHRNVGRMYELMETEGKPFITMEFVKGENLKNLISRKGQLSSDDAISIAKQMCEGLAEAHELGVIHRDLKPQNVMIDDKGRVKIMDFGIARSTKVPGVTATGMILGTPNYFSPEQAEGIEADQRSDIYSLGVILYEMVAGVVPFEGDTAFSVALKHKTQLPPDPRKINPEISENLCRLILVCLEKERERRYQTAGALLEDLRNIEEGFPLGTKMRPRRETAVAALIRNKFFIPALVVALVIIMLIIWQFFPQKGAAPIQSDKPSVAIMYFKNNTGDESLDIWKTALSDSLITDLSQSKHIKVLSGDKLYQILSDLKQLETTSYSSDILSKVASRGDATHIIQGNYAKAGKTIRIDVTLQDSKSGEIIGSERVEGEGEASFFSMVDELTRKIKVDFRLKPKELLDDIDREAASITTSSPEAYRYYIEAKRLFHKREFQQSLVLFEKAVSIDPEFAMAYREMAFTQEYVGNEVERVKYLEKALALTDRISDRERYVIQTTYYLVQHRDYPKAIEACERLLELYPDDLWGNERLGAMYLDIEEWDKAVDQFRIIVQIYPESVDGYTRLASAYIALGMHNKVQEVLDYYLHNYPDDGRIHYALGRNYIHQQKYKPALLELEKAISLNSGIWGAWVVKGDIFLFDGDFFTAEKEYQQLQKKENFAEHIYSRDRLANLYLLQGKFEKSKEFTYQAIDLAKNSKTWESYFYAQLAYQHLKSGKFEEALGASDKGSVAFYSSLCVKCLAYLKMNLVEEAQKITNELKSIINEGRAWKETRYYYLCLGLIELEKEDYSEAIQYFEKAIPLLPGQLYISLVLNQHALFLEPLALAYFKSGKLEEAREKFEAITTLTYGRLYYGDIYAKAFYMLGKIYEQQGDSVKAREHYEKFLDMWKEADPGIPEVDDARSRLFKIEGEA